MGEAASRRRNRRRSVGLKHATNQTAVSRRPRRQSFAHGGAQRGARETHSRRNQRRGAEADRRSRDRRHHPQAGSGRPSWRDRRRVSPHFLELRFPRTARQRRVLCRRAQDQVHQRRPAAAPDPVARDRQARRLQAASDDRAFQILEGAHQADRQGDDPVAVVAALPLRPRRRAGIDLPVDGRLLSRSRSNLSQGGARVRRRRLPLSAARRSQSRVFVRSIAPHPHHGARRGSGDACQRSMPA